MSLNPICWLAGHTFVHDGGMTYCMHCGKRVK